MSIELGTLLSNAGELVAYFNQASSALGTLRELLKREGHPQELVDQFVILSVEVGEMKLKAAHLESELLTLQRTLDAEEKIEERKRKYVLAPTPVGEFVYSLKPDADPSEPRHHVCPNCYENDQIRVLQPRGPVLTCTNCSTTYGNLPDLGMPSVGRRHDPFDGYL